MFLDLLKRRNPALLDAAAQLHRAGAIPPNTYVIDLDAVGRNAAAFAAEASRLGLRPFAMTKQIGRNPDVSRELVSNGISHAVGVDLECAIAARNGGLAVGHLGHLVQIPRHQAVIAASLQPLYWTVFSETKAHEAGAASVALGRVQDLLLRVVAPEDRFYAGHEGGFPLDGLVAAADRIDTIPGVRVAGVTTFPATLFDAESGTAVATPNRATLTRAKLLLEASGRRNVQVNAPGTTSISVLADLAAAGATQVEPGHGLTGTTPLHAVEDLVEEPAIAYVSEVSHFYDDSAYVFGGGLYVDPVLGDSHTNALVYRGGSPRLTDAVELAVAMPAAESIDYYCSIPLGPEASIEIGDTVIFGFRPQVFVTRALTAAISGISSGTPRVEGIWAATGAAPLTPLPAPPDPQDRTQS
ncbi:alanine racemase [Cryobacterium sp. N19]|uniref:alanine racemase n=1 Tax=Cryobacterium sp. N19 TaxID=2048288 RepID=UPI000CE2EEDE|nr:alanine racemase [Cryobacterium sp. N19]